MNARQRRLINSYTRQSFSLGIYRFDLWIIRLFLLAGTIWFGFHI